MTNWSTIVYAIGISIGTGAGNGTGIIGIGDVMRKLILAFNGSSAETLLYAGPE